MSESVERLFERYRGAGETAALAEVFDRTAPEVLRIAMHLAGSVDAAEDLLQATFLEAIEHADRFDARRPLVPWLLGILANQARMRRRREARTPDARRLDRSNGPAPDEAAQRRELSEAVERALAGLEEPYRRVVELKLREGLESGEIARSLKRPPGTVRAQLHRGLDLLRKLLPVGFSLAGVSVADAGRGLPRIRESVLGRAALRSGAAAGVAGGLLSTKSVVAASVLLALAVGALLWVLHGAEPRGSGRAQRRAEDDLPAPARGETSDEVVARADLPSAGARTAPASANGTLLVQARLRETMQPAGGVPFFVFWRRTDPHVFLRFGLTGPDGTARVEGLGGERWMLLTQCGAMQEVDADRSGEVALDVEVLPAMVVTGRVVDAEGRPVEGAEILLAPPMTPSPVHPVARADARGEFRLPRVVGGQFVAARAPGHGPSPVQGVQGRPGDTVEIQLVLAAEGGTVCGRVTTAGGEPLAGAIVGIGLFQQSGGWSPVQPDARVLTDRDGRFEARGLAPGASRLLVRAIGFAPREQRIYVVGNRQLEVDATLQKGAVIHGEVAGPDGGPLDGVRIRAGTEFPMTTSDATGRFRLEDLPAGRVTLTAEEPGGGKLTKRFELSVGAEVRWDPVFESGRRVTGVVVDEGGRPQAGWVVRISSTQPRLRWQARLQSDGDGRFAFEPPSADASYRLEAKPAHEDRFWLAEVEGVRVGTAPVTLRVESERRPSAFVEGRLFAADGSAAGGVTVLAWLGQSLRGAHAATAHADGSFRVGPLVPGRYRICFRHESRPWLERGPVTLETGEVLDLGEIRYPVAGRIELRLRCEDDSVALTASFLEGQFPPDRRPWETQEGESRLSIPLAPGRYEIGIFGRGAATLHRGVDVVPGRTTRLEIVAPRGVRRNLRFIPPADAPPAGSYELHVLNAHGDTVAKLTGRPFDGGRMGYAGSFAPGRHTVRVETDTGLRAEESFEVPDLTPSRDPIEIPLR